MKKNKDALVIFLIAAIIVLLLIIMGMFLHFNSIITANEGNVIVQLG